MKLFTTSEADIRCSLALHRCYKIAISDAVGSGPRVERAPLQDASSRALWHTASSYLG
jgi:hypothetical protein